MKIVLSGLIHRGLINPEMENDRNYLWGIVNDNLEIIDDLQMVANIHKPFVNYAKDAFSKKDNQVGIVLLATSIEQIINTNYRLILGLHNFSNDEITIIIKTTNYDAKLSWLFKLATNTEFPKGLKKKIQEVFETRNSIIHYKAMPTPIYDPDFVDNIKKNFDTQGIKDILNLPELIDNHFVKIYQNIDLDYERIEKLVNIFSGNIQPQPHQ